MRDVEEEEAVAPAELLWELRELVEAEVQQPPARAQGQADMYTVFYDGV